MNKLAAMSDAASTKSASPAGTTSSAGSKRKRGTEPKFYSVRAGHKPGIYLSWAECLAQIKGFKGAMCEFAPRSEDQALLDEQYADIFSDHSVKSFTSLVDAEKFLAGDDPTNDPASSTYQPKFYGVKNGRVPGVYTDWPSAQKQIIGWTKPKHKCFTSRAEAEAYLKSGDETRATNGASSSTPEAQRTTESTRDSPDEVNGTAKKQKRTGPTISNLLDGHDAKFAGDADSNSEDSQDADDPDLDDRQPKPESPKKGKPKATPQKRGGVLRIYTDGSSLGNGKFGASAGVGVYFGEDDER
jgi:ribonuclease HI